jgi:NAD(P)H-flavin reductase
VNAIEYHVDCHIQLSKTLWQLFASPVKEVMHYEAGQYLLLKYPNGNLYPFSIANAPNDSYQIELHIRSNPDDTETKAFLVTIMTTTKIALSGPFGECQYQEKDGPLLLLAAGTGFAPAKAILEQLTKTPSKRPSFLYWTVRKPDDFYCPELPEFFKNQLFDFHYIPICTKIGYPQYRTNILTAVSEDFDSLSSCQIYVFGPRALAIDALHAFIRKGLCPEDFFTDVLSKEDILQM